MKNGDIIQLGEHRLIIGDSTDPQIVAKVLKDAKVDAIITDPPYGVNYVDGALNKTKHKQIENDDISDEGQYKQFTEKWLSPALENMASYNQIYIFHADLMTCPIRSAMKDLKIYHSQNLIWVKNASVIGRKDYLPQHELIAYGWYGRHKFNVAKDKSVIFYPRPSKSRLHPTMKPVGLMRKLVMNSTDVGGVVYDPFLGSGSTLIACEHVKRVCIGIEKDPEYAKIIAERWKKLTSKEYQVIS